MSNERSPRWVSSTTYGTSWSRMARAPPGGGIVQPLGCESTGPSGDTQPAGCSRRIGGRLNQRVERSVLVPAARAQVWDALTRRELLSEWFEAEVLELELRPR